ncbi:MAG: YqgE/AlgH family protein, partial [Nitrospiraceae bacterium]
MMTNHGPRQQRTTSIGAVLGLCLAVALSLAAALAGALSPRSTTDDRHAGAAARPPAKGLFLVASPDLADPNFQHTVILICEHSQAGSLGL